MTTEALKAIGLTEEQIKQVFALNGKEIEKLKAEASAYKKQAESAAQEARQQINKARMEDLLYRRLKEAGARNPQLVKSLLNLEQLSLEEDGIGGLEEQLERIKSEEGYLFEEDEHSPVFAKAIQAKQGTSGFTKEQIRSMAPEEINRHWAEISEILKRG